MRKLGGLDSTSIEQEVLPRAAAKCAASLA
jgi:hypothetical protein